LYLELELEQMQARMTQKPLLWVEVRAHARCAKANSALYLTSQCDCIFCLASNFELELGVIQTHMAQTPLMWVEAGAHALSKRAEVVWAGAGVAWRLCVFVFEAFWTAWRRF
jgi:hypothetical protein